MRFTTEKSGLAGQVRIPASKSHTVRAAILAALAEGESVIRSPLESGDTLSALATAEAFGATVSREKGLWRVCGRGRVLEGWGQTIDVGNSGTTLYIALAVAGLIRSGQIRFDGDEQIRRRSAANLLSSLKDLGCRFEVEGNPGCCPIVMRGTLAGGRTTIECQSSQYLSSLLLACPLADGDSVIEVPVLYEQPYVHITLRWMEELGIRLNYADDLSRFEIPGGQKYRAFDKEMAGDFSSATFFLCAAAMTGSELTLSGMDMTDAQGDKQVVEYLRAMGAEIAVVGSAIRVEAGCALKGAELDLNATPDALPAMAVAAALAEGKTLLGNVPQARMKETDRIAVMARELAKLGVDVTERDDGLEILGGGIGGGSVNGHGDHRVVMAFAIAGLVADGPVTVDTAESASITFPDFAGLLESVGGKITVAE